MARAMSNPPIPPVFKRLKRFLVQARELEKVSPVASYYCRYVFVKRGMALEMNAPEAKRVLESVMGKMEKQKASLPEDKAKRREIIIALALRVFESADNEDREGLANKATAKKYRAAVNIMEAANSLGAPDEKIQEMQKYAQWKFVDILKALKEGRKPTPGNGTEEDELAALEREVAREATDDKEQGEREFPASDAAVRPMPAPAPEPAPAPASTLSGKNRSTAPMDVNTVVSAAPTPTPASIVRSGGARAAAPMDITTADYTTLPQPTGPAAAAIRNDGKHQYEAATAAFDASTAPTAPSAPAVNVAAPVPLGALVVRPTRSKDKLVAEMQAEKFIKYANSSIRFHDVDGAITNLKEAMAVLLPYRSSQ